MDDKNMASQLIDKMRRYIRGNSEEAEQVSEPAPEVKSEPETKSAEPKRAMRLPSEESLFDFEGFELDDEPEEEAEVEVEETAAEVAEAETVAEEAEVAVTEENVAFEEIAEEITEKPESEPETVSDSVSVFFDIPLTPIETIETVAEHEPIEPVAEQTEEVTENVESEEAAEEAAETEVTEPAEETATVEESEQTDEEAVNEVLSEVDDINKHKTGQIIFPIFEDEDTEDEPRILDEVTEIPAVTEKAAEPEGDETAVPRFFNPFGVQERFDIPGLDFSDDKTENIPEPTVVSGLDFGDGMFGYDDSDVDEFYDLDDTDELDEASELEKLYDADNGYYGESEVGAKAVEAESDEAMEYNNDVWDDEERAVWAEKERFTDLCASLPLPEVRIEKTSKLKDDAGNSPVLNSGYRYEMTERLPLFPDGLRGGKENQGYIDREKAYCIEREDKRREQLNAKLKKSVIGIVLAALCLAAMLVYENIGTFVGDFMHKNIYVFAGLDIILILVSAFIAKKAILDGMKCAVRGIFIPETLTGGVIIFSVLYNISLMLCSPLPESSMLFGIPAAVAVFLTMLYRYYLLKREQKVFNVAASYGSYSTEVKMYGFRNTPEGAAFEGYASPNSSLYRINRISRIDGVYNEQPQRDECYGIIRILTLCILCASAVAGAVFGLITREVYSGVLGAYSVIALASPVSVFVALLAPRYVSAKEAARDGGAVIDFDEESDEFDDNVIMIDDSELYRPEDLKIVKFDVCKSPMLEKHLARAAAMFKKTGGTLRGLFRNMEQNLSGLEKVVVTEVSDHGLTAKVDGNTVRAGSASYMESHGIKVEKYLGVMSSDTRVLYISDNGEFFTRIVLGYTPNETLCRKIAGLRHADTVVSLKTCDPCIDKALVFCTTGLEPELLRVIKFRAGDDLAPAETDREGMLVSNNGATGLITALLEYKRQKKLIFGASRFAAMACIVGVAAALFVTALGIRVPVMSAATLLFHAVLSGIGVFVGTRGAINTKNKIKKK